MLSRLIQNPETLAHWIVAFPFLAFAYITLKLLVNRNVAAKPLPTDKTGKLSEEEIRKLVGPAWSTYLMPILVAAAVVVLLAMGRTGTGFFAGITAKNALFWVIIGIPLIHVIFFPNNSRKWAQKYGPYISVGAIGLSAVIAFFLWWKTIHIGAYPAAALDDTRWLEPWRFTWIAFGDYAIDIGVKLDGFGVFGAFMVTVVALCIQWFSLGYMWDDEYGRKHIGRYFAEHSLFATGMLGVVLADNILTFLIGWEVMGLCSYLLIGFFTYKPSANAAQMKAFIVTRIGDVGFMLGIFMLGLMFTYTKQPISLNLEEIRSVVVGYNWWEAGLGWLPTVAALLIFMGAVGKSAQFPLHVWLPDAMEGPTPVSALIHAATMVAAGVFLVARFFWLFELSPTAMMTVAWIGAITAFGAATIGVVQYDLKRILAYSTISQLGYMMIGLGVGAVSAGIFHMLAHAYFKALLFLGSGAVIYGCRHIQDIRYMGGLSKKMPLTYITFLAGTLALAGIFPFAGFWSKDEILAGAFHLGQHGYTRIVPFSQGEESVILRVQEMMGPNAAGYVIWFLGLAGAFITAFYMFRLISYVFLGTGGKPEFRGPQSPEYGHHAPTEADTAAYSAWPTPPGPFEKEEREHGPVEPKDPPSSMTIPLVILALFSLGYGLIGAPFMGERNLVASFLHHFHDFRINPESLHEHLHFPQFDGLTIGLMVLSFIVAIAGLLAGLAVNNTPAGIRLKEKWKAALPGLYRTVYNKYYVDEFYESYVVQPVFFICQVARAFDNYIVDGIVNAAGWITWQFARLQGWWDNVVIDGIVNGVAWLTGFLSDTVKPIQSGYVQNYMMVVVVFVLFYLLTLFVR